MLRLGQHGSGEELRNAVLPVCKPQDVGLSTERRQVMCYRDIKCLCRCYAMKNKLDKQPTAPQTCVAHHTKTFNLPCGNADTVANVTCCRVPLGSVFCYATQIQA